MSLDQGEVLQNLLSQRTELEKGHGTTPRTTGTSETQYLKLTGAIDVLQQQKQKRNQKRRMSFFKSDIVQQELKEIGELQEKIYKKVWEFPNMDSSAKLVHVELLEELLNKQRVLYTRMTLSDDPSAKEMKESIMVQQDNSGSHQMSILAYVFGNMTHIIDNMKKSLRES